MQMRLPYRDVADLVTDGFAVGHARTALPERHTDFLRNGRAANDKGQCRDDFSQEALPQDTPQIPCRSLLEKIHCCNTDNPR